MGLKHIYIDDNVSGEYWKIGEVFFNSYRLVSHCKLMLFKDKAARDNGAPPLYEMRWMWCAGDFFLTNTNLESSTPHTLMYDKIKEVWTDAIDQ